MCDEMHQWLGIGNTSSTAHTCCSSGQAGAPLEPPPAAPAVLPMRLQVGDELAAVRLAW